MPDFFRSKEPQNPCGTQCLGENGSECGTGNTHVKNEDENRVKADVDNRADEDRAHRCAGMSLAADKGIQSDSQFNKYRSDKINRNIRGSISNRVVTCAEEIQKRCLKDKEKCHQKHGKK